MICPYCNAEISNSMKFCEICGAALPVESALEDPVFDNDPNQPEQQPANNPYADAQHIEQQFDQGQYGQQPSEQQQYWQQTTEQQPFGQPGAAPMPPGVYAPAADAQVSNTPFGLAIAALVTAVLGIFPVSIVLAIIALVMNSGQKKRGEISTKQGPTKVMSIISLVLSAIMFVFTLLLGGAVVAYLASEEFNASSTGASTSASQSHSSSTTAGNATSGSDVAPSASGSAAETGSLAGTWKLTALESNGQATKPEDIELMQNMGLKMEMTLNEDGTAALTLFGVDMTGTWEKADETTVILMLDGETIVMEASGDTLVMADDGDVMTFTKQ